MDNGFFLYRWFRDVSIARKLYFTVGAMALLIGVELFVLLFSLNTLSSLRAYVGGEGLWSKALKATPNLDVAREGFLEGRNHPDDVDGMISLFIDFSSISYIRKAINIWSDAQPMAEQLLTIAQKLREEIQSPHPSQDRIDQLLGSVYTIDQRLTTLEDQFSFTLGEGSRWLESVVLRLLFATALTVETTGLLLTFSVSKAIQQGLTSIIRAAKEFSTGQLGARAKVLSRDEIGVVASSFNEMADNLEKRVGELAELNRDKEHEIAERERAETELRSACAHLEVTLRELQCQTAERLRAEEMLRQSEKMKALGQLTGGIAHDFNNLLGVIIGSVEFLMDAVRNSPEHTELAREILNSALSGSLLTRRLLAVARNQPLRPQRVDLNALLQDNVAMLRRTLGEAIHIEATRSPELWYTSADPSQIGDALLNLALNARDAMPQGGRLTIEAANFHLDARGAAPYSELRNDDYV